MLNSQELIKLRQQKLEERRKQNQEQINKEMLELEKAYNNYVNSSLEKEYFELPCLIKSETVKKYIEDNGYVIDKMSTDIEPYTTRIWISEESYNNHINPPKGIKKINENEIESEKEHVNKLQPYKYADRELSNEEKEILDNLVKFLHTKW